MGYRVKTDVFEGPFALLVYLIEHAQMSIYDIRVAEITDQYLEYVGDMEKADVGVASEFMALAALLLEIKSKMLLPKTPAGTEGGEPVEDPGPNWWQSCWNTRNSRLLRRCWKGAWRRTAVSWKSLRRI